MIRFHIPTRIYFGTGIINQLPDVVNRELGAKNPILVTDKGVIAAGLVDKVLGYFPGIPIVDKIEPNPRHTTVDQGGEAARRKNADMVIAMGGGSALDAGKAIAVLATNSGSIEDYEGRAKYISAPLPVIAIPTTCGTGSEVTWVSVITHVDRKFKMSIKGPLMFPAAAIVDPDMLLSLPRDLIASTGLDALTHAIEAYTVKPASFMTDIFAREAIKLIFSSLEEACKDIALNNSARIDIMKGSMVAGLAFGNSDVGAVHCIAESVGSMYDTPHGIANSIFLPFVMEANLVAVARRYAQIGYFLGIKKSDDISTAKSLIQRIRELSERLNIPAFKDLGITEETFDEIAKKSEENNSNPSNPVELSKEDYLHILEQARNY